VRGLLHQTSPLNPLSILERGFEPTRKIGFLPLLQIGEGGRGDEVLAKIPLSSIIKTLTNWVSKPLVLLFLIFLLSACGAPPDLTATPTLINLLHTPRVTPDPNAPIPSPTPSSLLSGRFLTSVEQAEAPAITWVDDTMLVTWIGADDVAVYHYAQWRFGDVWQRPQALPILANRPYKQKLVTTSDNIVYLIWLDALPNFPEPQRVWYAPISENYTINPGALALTNQEAWDFSAVGISNGGIWTIWQGGILSEPTLYSQFIDSLGRPRFSTPILENATNPILITDRDGQIWLFWLSNQRLWRGKWSEDGVLSDAMAIGDSVRISLGSLLTDFRVGIANGEGFAFWQINQRDGTIVSYWSYGNLDNATWTAPQPHSTLWFIPNQLVADTMTAVGMAMSEPYDLRVYQWTGSYWWAEETGVEIPSALLRPPTWLYRDADNVMLGWSQPYSASADLWLWTGE